MLHLVRNNSPYTVIILCIFTLLVKLQVIGHPAMPVVVPGHLLYNGIVQFLHVSIGFGPIGFTWLATIMILLQGLALSAIVNRYKLYNKPSYIFAYLYVLFSSLAPSLGYFTETLLVNWCMLAAFSMLLSFHQTSQPRKQIFNCAFILSIAALLHFPAILFLLLLFITLILLRSFNPGEYIVGLLGYFTPVYFFAGVLFLIDKLPEIRKWPYVITSFKGQLPYLPYTIGASLGLGILFICGIFVLQSQMTKLSVFMRRNWTMIAFYLFLSLAVAFDTFFSSIGAWLVIMPALSLIVANAFYLEKNKVFSNFVFYFSLALVVFCQLTIK